MLAQTTANQMKLVMLDQVEKTEILEAFLKSYGNIARNPIYYEDDTFWGFSVVVLDLPDILIPFGLEGLKEQNYEYRLTVGSVEGEKEIASTMSQYNERIQ